MGALELFEAGEIYVRCEGGKEHAASGQPSDDVPLGLGEDCVWSE
jgi:hypothetical protein